MNLQLTMATVQTNVDVNASPPGIDNPNVGDTTVLNTTDVQRMADDPDDFLRELQMLASEAGGNPTSAVILVDGVQNPSALPPKASIASIRIAPDLFSAKYEWPETSEGCWVNPLRLWTLRPSSYDPRTSLSATRVFSHSLHARAVGLAARCCLAKTSTQHRIAVHIAALTSPTDWR